MAQLSSPSIAHGGRCGLTPARGAARTAFRAGLWAEQFPFKGQAARWKTHTQPVSSLKKKRRHISADVKSRLGHAAVLGPRPQSTRWASARGLAGLLGAAGRRAPAAGSAASFPGLCLARRRVPLLTFSGQGLAQSERSGKGTLRYLEQNRSWPGLAGLSENSRSEAAWLVCMFLKSSTENPGREPVRCRGQQTGQPGADSVSRPPLGKARAGAGLRGCTQALKPSSPRLSHTGKQSRGPGQCLAGAGLEARHPPPSASEGGSLGQGHRALCSVSLTLHIDALLRSSRG